MERCAHPLRSFPLDKEGMPALSRYERAEEERRLLVDYGIIGIRGIGKYGECIGSKNRLELAADSSSSVPTKGEDMMRIGDDSPVLLRGNLLGYQRLGKDRPDRPWMGGGVQVRSWEWNGIAWICSQGGSA